MTTRNDAEPPTLIRTARDLLRDAMRPDINLDAFLADALRRTRELVPFDVGWLLLREGDRVRIRAADAAHKGDVGMTFPIADCVSGQSMLRRSPICISDLRDMPADLRRVYKPSRSSSQPMRSELVVPLLIGEGEAERAIGALNIESPEPNAFAAGQIELLRLLADHAALAIELARSRQEAAALSAISLQLARETELDDIVRMVLERALGLVGGRFGQMLLNEGGELVVHYTTNAPPRDIGLRFGVHDSVSGLAIETGQPVIVPDVDKAEYWVVDAAAAGSAAPRIAVKTTDRPRYQRVLEREKARIRAEFAAPLLGSDGSAVGVLNVETPREEGFTAAQRDRLAELARQRGAYFSQALEKGDGASLRTLLDEALAIGGTTFGQLLEVDLACAAEGKLVIVATTGGEPTGTRVSLAGSVSGAAAALGQPHYVPDVDADARYHRYLGEEMKSELAVPLISGETALGVLNLESPAPGFFTAEHAQTLLALAGQAAVAVERARRFEVERLAAIGGLAGDIVHRLNNPVGALSGWVEMLKRKEFYGELIARYPYVEQFVGRLERDLARSKSIIQELRAELKRRAPAPVALQSAVAEAIQRAGIGEDGPVRVLVDLPAEPLYALAGPSLPGILWNLLDNAAKAMPGGGTVTIRGRRGPEPNRLTVEVADEGVGIEPWRLASIFEPAASTTANSYAPTHGLGLWWTKGQMESFGGSIDVASEPGKGTRFKLIFRAQ